MKIAYVRLWDDHHVSIKMRSNYFKAKCLVDNSLKLTYVGPFHEKYQQYFNAKQKIYALFKRNYEKLREPVILKSFADQIQAKLSKLDVDIVFSHSSIPVSLLKCPQPIVFWVDATFAGMVDFYPEFSNLSQESLRKGNAQEQAALTNCSLAIYSSEWAADTAVKNYQVDSAKIRVVPFGANLPCDRTEEDILNFLKLRSPKMCKLLFFGVDWHRKGGDLALELAGILNKNGLPTELSIIGCDPLVHEALPEFVKMYGFINKTSRPGLAKIEEILSKTHFLIHPARAEAFACVLSEANSFGVPCLVANVGGLATPIKDDINGRLFPRNCSMAAYADFVLDIFSNYNKYDELAMSSFQAYQSRLNWNVAGLTVKNLLAELI